MSRRSIDNLKGALILLAVWSLALLWVCGCKAKASNKEYTATSNHLAGADAYVVSAMPETSKNGKVMLEHARVEIKAAAVSNDKFNLAFIAMQVAYAHLKGKWYVWLGQWIERLAWVIAGSWALSGIFGVLAGGGFLGAGKLFKAGRFILALHHAAPLPNPWSPLANYLNNAREVGV